LIEKRADPFALLIALVKDGGISPLQLFLSVPRLVAQRFIDPDDDGCAT
jgi:hypothetical protein